MNTVLALVGLLALLALLVHVGRLIARDGLGSMPTPRSHREELGTWVDQRLTR